MSLLNVPATSILSLSMEMETALSQQSTTVRLAVAQEAWPRFAHKLKPQWNQRSSPRETMVSRCFLPPCILASTGHVLSTDIMTRVFCSFDNEAAGSILFFFQKIVVLTRYSTPQRAVKSHLQIIPAVTETAWICSGLFSVKKILELKSQFLIWTWNRILTS